MEGWKFCLVVPLYKEQKTLIIVGKRKIFFSLFLKMGRDSLFVVQFRIAYLKSYSLKSRKVNSTGYIYLHMCIHIYVCIFVHALYINKHMCEYITIINKKRVSTWEGEYRRSLRVVPGSGWRRKVRGEWSIIFQFKAI